MTQYAFKACTVSNVYCPNAVFLEKLTKNMLLTHKKNMQRKASKQKTENPIKDKGSKKWQKN